MDLPRILMAINFILTLQAIFYCHGVNGSDDGNNEGNPDDTTSGFLNLQWSELWGGIVQSHDDPRSNLKMSRNKRRANNFESRGGEYERYRNYQYRNGATSSHKAWLKSPF